MKNSSSRPQSRCKSQVFETVPTLFVAPAVSLEEMEQLYRPQFEKWYLQESRSTPKTTCPLCQKSMKLDTVRSHLRNNICPKVKKLPAATRTHIFTIWKEANPRHKMRNAQTETEDDYYELSHQEKAILNIKKLTGYRILPNGELQYQVTFYDKQTLGWVSNSFLQGSSVGKYHTHKI
jgi:hypothetical protein